MEKKEFKIFKDLFLEDKDILTYFKNIFSAESKDKAVPLEELKKLETESEKLKIKIANLEQDNKKLTDLLNAYKNNYDTLDNMFYIYDGLSSETKERLANVFSGKTSLEFFAGAVQIENILTFWDFIKRRIIENERTDIQSLSKIFCFLLNMYNCGKNKNEYEFIKPEQNETFDSDRHYILGTKTDGKIDEVLLVGFYNIKTNKVYKAIVSVK